MSTALPLSGLRRLLHLEDNLTDAELIAGQIGDEWPDCVIKRVDTRADFVAALGREQFDLILSDFSLPSFDGLAALDLARERGPDTPFIFLSGASGEKNARTALQRGAADYLSKDRPERLIPAIRAALEQRQDRLRRRTEDA
jgi:CheY-like chemotaxis protein